MKTTRVDRQQKLGNFLNDLLTCCAAGKEFKFSAKRKEYGVSSEVSTYIRKFIVSDKGGFKYLWKANIPPNTIASTLSSMKLVEVKKHLNHVPQNNTVGSPSKKYLGVVAEPKATKVVLETPELSTKKEVKSVQTSMNFEAKDPSQNVEVTKSEKSKLENIEFELRVTVEKTWGNGNRESISYPVSGVTFDNLKNKVKTITKKK